jgi:hypothetical protein
VRIEFHFDLSFLINSKRIIGINRNAVSRKSNLKPRYMALKTADEEASAISER